MPSTESRDEIQKLLASLLITRKEANTRGVPISLLDRDYKDETGRHIPYRDYGHGCLPDFLQSLTDRLRVRLCNGVHYVFPVVTEKTKHVSALVAGQNYRKIARPARRMARPSAYYPKVQLPPMRLDSGQLLRITRFVQKNAGGVHQSQIINYVRGDLYCNIEWLDLSRQLRDLRHEVYVAGDWVYPVRKIHHHEEHKQQQQQQQQHQQQPQQQQQHHQQQQQQQQPQEFSTSGESPAKIQLASFNDRYTFAKPAGYSDSEREDYSTDYYASTDDKRQKEEDKTSKEIQNSEEKRSEHPATNSSENSNVKCPPGQQESQETNSTNDDAISNGESVSRLINERTRIRLQKLIEKHPGGIWCADLPELYRTEYTIPLNYEDLGFVSVIEFVSHLPDIFKPARLQDKGDFKLFDAKTGVPEFKTRERPKLPSLAALHDIYEQFVEPTQPVPSVLSKLTKSKLIPNGVMTADETVAQICVTELDRGLYEYIDVMVCDVYTPSFFWIHILKRVNKFQKFMTDLHEFYEQNAKQYVLPMAVMEKGLNCACMYDGKWHRAVIKSVRPDNYVTLMFYDYGTIKSYPVESVHFLHRRFSNLPAQAIPCGLYNVKPVTGTHWSWNISCEFVTRTVNTPLVATIASIDTENNSMMVTLTNTEGPEDFHINDWMVQAGFAVYGRMVCIRPRNYPYRRYLECKMLKSPESGKDPLSNDSKTVDSNANNDRIESDLLKKRNFYDRLLKLRREARARKESTLPIKESSGEESENRRSCEEPKIVKEILVEMKDESSHASDQPNLVTREKPFDRKKLKDLYELNQKRKALSNFSNTEVPKNHLPHHNIDKADLKKHCNIETPTDESTTDDDRIPITNEVVPLHLKDSGRIDGLDEFGTLHSTLGGNGRMEFIDWSAGSKTAKVDKKTRVPNGPPEVEEKINKDSTKHEPKMHNPENIHKVDIHEIKKTVKETKHCSEVTGKENNEPPNWNGPKIPLAKRALWNLVKNSAKQSSSDSGGSEGDKKEKNDKSGVRDENGDSGKKKTPIFPVIEKENVSKVEKVVERGEKGHCAPVPLSGINKNSEIKGEVPITKKNHNLQKNGMPSYLLKADKYFVRMMNEVVLSKSANDELAFVSEGNIEMRKDRKPRLKMMRKKMAEKRQERLKIFMPNKILDVITRRDFIEDSSDIKASSESLGEMDEGSTTSLNSSKSKSMIDFLESKDSSSEISIEKASCPLDKGSLRNNRTACPNEKNSCSTEKKSSDSRGVHAEEEQILKSPEKPNAWFRNVCPKLTTPQRSSIRSCMNSTFNTTLDSDDLSTLEENKASKNRSFVTVNSPLSSLNNSRVEERSVESATDDSPELTNGKCSDIPKVVESPGHDKNHKELTTVSSKSAICKEAPVFNDLNLESDDDEWDYCPGYYGPEVPEACERTTNYPDPSASDSLVIEELNSDKKSDESSFEVSENVDIDTRSSGSSGHETDTDTQTTDNKYDIIEDDSSGAANLHLTKDSTFTKSDFPLDNDDESRTPSRSCNLQTEKIPLIDSSGNISSNDESPRRNASLEQSLSAQKRYSILSEIQKSPIFNNGISFAELDSSSSGEQSDSSYRIPFINALKRYF